MDMLKNCAPVHILLVLCMCAVPAAARAGKPSAPASCSMRILDTLAKDFDAKSGDLERWIESHYQDSVNLIEQNTLPNGGMIAGGGQANREYSDVWTRDEAIGQRRRVKWLRELYDEAKPSAKNGSSGDAKKKLLSRLLQYLDFTRKIQQTPMPVTQFASTKPLIDANGKWVMALNPAVAKVHADQSPVMKEWGNPQNDGPALRSITLIDFANLLLDHRNDPVIRETAGDPDQVIKTLYGSAIKTDLEYTLHHTVLDTDPETARPTGLGFDYWEETMARGHFSTMITQQRALREGSLLADRVGDRSSARAYLEKAKKLEPQIRAMWDPERGFLLAMKDPVPGMGPSKPSKLDTQVLLSLLETRGAQGIFELTDEPVLATIRQTEKIFTDNPTQAYEINQNPEFRKKYPRSAAIGRYIEDRYNGQDPFRGPEAANDQGNPWVLIQNSWAELYYRIAAQLLASGKIDLNDKNLGFYQGAFGDPSAASALRPGSLLLAERNPLFQRVIGELVAKGDESLSIVKDVTLNGGGNYEQYNRKAWPLSPQKISSEGLSWNAVTFVDAKQARDEALALIRSKLGSSNPPLISP